MTLRPAHAAHTPWLRAVSAAALALLAGPLRAADAGPADAADLDGLADAPDYVRAEGGRLLAGASPLRLWGLALRGSPPLDAPLPADAEPETDPDATAFLRRLETLGVGFLRLDMPAADAPGEEGALRSIDRVLARSRAHDIHVWMGASHVLGDATSNDVAVLDDPASAEPWMRAVAAFPDGRLPLDGSLARAWDPRLELLETARLRDRFGHFNPVTGRRWADSPAVALWELEGPDGWHARMAAGEALSLPPSSFALLEEQLDDWLYDRYGDADAIPDPVPDTDREAFRDALWTAHKRRLADALRSGGASLRQAPLAWRETVEPQARPDGSGCFLLRARPGAVAGADVPAGDLAVLRVSPPDGGDGDPGDVWRVLAASGPFAAVAWDADVPTNDVPTAFQAAFAAAGDVFRAGIPLGRAAPRPAPDGGSSLDAPPVVWRRSPSATSLPLGEGAAAPVLEVPAATPAAVALVRASRARRTLYLALPGAPAATLALPAGASAADAFWKRLPARATVRAADGSLLAEFGIDALPRRLPLPAGAFRVDIVPGSEP